MLAPVDLENLRRFGFTVCVNVSRSASTLGFAETIGSVLNLHALSKDYPNRSVDVLTPKEKCRQELNRYHGNFGFEEYPLHTDLAHWIVPPRYLLLRGRMGLGMVSTFVLDAPTLSGLLPQSVTQRALFFPRQSRVTTALSFRISRTLAFSLRWDPIFIRPANTQASICAEIFRSSTCRASSTSINLALQTTTLVIDNWRCLHGRSAVPFADRKRSIERIYLESIYGISN